MAIIFRTRPTRNFRFASPSPEDMDRTFDTLLRDRRISPSRKMDAPLAPSIDNYYLPPLPKKRLPSPETLKILLSSSPGTAKTLLLCHA